KGFKARMEEIRARIRPKLETLGGRLAPELQRTTGESTFAHVARHARRTMNPPDDTWVAFAADARGYKKHSHFKFAVSRAGVRFLFEVGPEHADKKKWASAWKKNAPKLAPVLRRMKGLAWFKNEHDDDPAAPLGGLSAEEAGELGDELTRTRDGPARVRARRAGGGSRALDGSAVSLGRPGDVPGARSPVSLALIDDARSASSTPSSE